MSLRSQHSAGIPARGGPPGSDSTFSGYGPNTNSSGTAPASAYGSSRDPNRSINRDRDDSSSVRTGGSSSKAPSVSLEQSRQIARTHFDALQAWLTKEGAFANGSTRNNAREKLTRLTRQQFQELSTDVYDELVRRMDDAVGRAEPHLPPRNDFHPKRNQARQKLATLPLQRFRDLASDVYYELDRRYPEFREPETPKEVISSPALSSPTNAFQPPQRPGRGSISHPPNGFLPSNSNSNANSPSPSFGGNLQMNPPPNLNAARRANTPLGSATGSSNEVVVPNKSTLIMEDTAGAPPSNPRPGSAGASAFGQGGAFGSHKVKSASRDDFEDEQERLGGSSAQQTLGRNDTQRSRNSETSSVGTNTRFIGNYANSEAGGSTWETDEREKLKAEYEYKLTRLQDRVNELEREVEEGRQAIQGRSTDANRARDLEQQLRSQREQYDSLSSQHSRLRSDHDSLQAQSRQQSSSSGADSTRLRDELDRTQQAHSAANDQAEELRGEVTSLVDELRDASAREEQALQEVEQERTAREKAEEEAKDWRKKYEQTKTELRNIKATSQLFVSSINVNVQQDYLPASADGLLADVNVTAFQTSIDDLLQAARSKEPSSVLSAVRSVVSAVEKIDQDVQAIDPSRINSLSQSDQQQLNAAKANINATLSNLMTASKNHATSFGLSPVSLVDAAASHLSATVVDLVRILKIKKTTSSSSNNSRGASSLAVVPEVPPVPQSNGGGYLTSFGMSSVKSALGYGASATKEDAPPVPPLSAPPSSTLSPRLRSPQAPSPPAGPSEYQSFSATSSGQLHQQQNSWDRNGPPSHDYRSPPQLNSPDTGRGGGYNPQPLSSSGYNQYAAGGSLSPGGGDGGDRYAASSNGGYGASAYDYDQASNYSPTPNGGGPSVGGYGGESQGGGNDYGSPELEPRPENNLHELKNYIENQTEAIVHSIQSLLSAIRSGAQTDELNENLTQIITIVSSIVAICSSALPAQAKSEGDGILSDLAANCDKLSEMQSQAEGQGQGQGQAFGKATKQSMASASFGVAKSLKMLNGLLTNAVAQEEDSLM